MTISKTDDHGLDPRQRASARFTAVTRLAAEVPDVARLHCAAAVEALGTPPPEAPLRHLRDHDVDGLIRAALRDLGSLPLDQFADVRTAAEHGRRALLALD